MLFTPSTPPLDRDQVDIRQADPDAPEALTCLQAYFAELAVRIPSLDTGNFPVPDPDAQSYRAPRGCFLIAWHGNLPVGCVSLRPLDATTGEVKRLWVDTSARGLGLAHRLMSAVECEARNKGYRDLKLDTNSALTAALMLYKSNGWTEIPPYTGKPADVWLGKTL